eukprot:scaffold31668_cov55-Attheya_sp.AAC.2
MKGYGSPIVGYHLVHQPRTTPTPGALLRAKGNRTERYGPSSIELLAHRTLFASSLFFDPYTRHTQNTCNNQQKQETHHGPFDANNDPHGSSTTTNHPHPMSPTVTDTPSHLLYRTWSECVVAALLDVWSMYPIQTCRSRQLHDDDNNDEDLLDGSGDDPELPGHRNRKTYYNDLVDAYDDTWDSVAVAAKALLHGKR